MRLVAKKPKKKRKGLLCRLFTENSSVNWGTSPLEKVINRRNLLCRSMNSATNIFFKKTRIDAPISIILSSGPCYFCTKSSPLLKKRKPNNKQKRNWPKGRKIKFQQGFFCNPLFIKRRSTVKSCEHEKEKPRKIEWMLLANAAKVIFYL